MRDDFLNRGLGIGAIAMYVAIVHAAHSPLATNDGFR